MEKGTCTGICFLVPKSSGLNFSTGSFFSTRTARSEWGW